ncbi:hypothetical protein K435DRAFT_804173 [Dendrothele bispora CBS 962.96]|uniref:Uncharacterized protein n=1 Tax=Dendrothele bispora (strain CBS 962.96) TaxID=1314807 RepID=A0A4S8LFI2_DENBC|nr:hypothetical protein K435DRAFT_804173 [Dendrothele bispora CBS 962.96]
MASDHSKAVSHRNTLTFLRHGETNYCAPTEPIKELILHASFDAPIPERFTHFSFQFISLAEDALKNINYLIARTDSDDQSYKDFEDYTMLIPATEDILFKYMDVVKNESEWLGLSEHGAFASTAHYSIWIKQWAKARDGLQGDIRRFMKSLHEKLKSVFSDMKNASKTVPPEGYKALESYKDLINEFGRGPFNGETADRAAGVALEGSCKIDDARAKGFELPPTFFENLQTVFRAITDLLQKKDNASLTKVDEKIQGFRTDHITGKSGPIVDLGIIELLRLVRGVHRPFYGRASTLVKLFKEKAYVLGSKGPGSEYNKVHELVRTTITDSASSIRSLSLDIPEDQKASLNNKFSMAEQRITSKLDEKSRAEWQKKIEKAQELDETHMKRIRDAKANSEIWGHIRSDQTASKDHPQTMKTITLTVLHDKQKKEFDYRDPVTMNPIFKDSSGKVIDMDLNMEDAIVGHQVTLLI